MIQGARLFAGCIAALALALSATAHLAAIGGVDVEARYPQVWWLHFAAMALLLPAVLVAARLAGPKRRLRDLAATLPVWASAAIVLSFVYTVGNFVLLVPETGAGNPIIEDGRYFFNDHGNMREVSETAFHAQRSLSLRLYSAVWVYLCLISALVLLLARRQGNLDQSR